MTTNAHHDRIQCPICLRKFDTTGALAQHQLCKGHYHAHEPRPFAHLVKPIEDAAS